MASIRLDNLVKRFSGGVEAVGGVSLDIADGEFVVLVGPSGCGKTTTLNMIAGLERPTAGDIWIGNDRVTDWEPGDRQLGVEMRTELKRLHAQLGATFVYVTHDQAEAMTMADRIVVMDQGRIHQVGPPLTIYNDPTNRFVAGFFGVPAMNFIEGELREAAGGLVFQAPVLRLGLARTTGAGAGPAVLGVRPEHLRLADGGEGSSVTVSLIEPLC